jgi:DNA polymerase-3 subunit delta
MGEVHLLKGSDEVLLAEEAHRLVERLVGDADRGEVLEEFTGDDFDLGAVVLAASTVSMFGERIVVARNLARFRAADVAPLVELLADPPPDTSLVLVWSPPMTSGATSQAVPKKLADAVKGAGGEVHDCGVPAQARARGAWFDEQFDAAPVRLDGGAKRLLVERLGEDVARLAGILSVLAEVHGPGARLGADEVEPFVGEGGGVPPWELTDAIDAGDVPGAVSKARRMVHGGGRHPLAVMATLQTHLLRMVRLDGAGATSEQEAAALLGMKGSTFPAKKALAQSRRLGSERLARAVQLLSDADVDLRGRTGLPGEQVLEVLVARLARMSAAAGGGRRR